jgi:hypothetical protein
MKGKIWNYFSFIKWTENEKQELWNVGRQDLGLWDRLSSFMQQDSVKGWKSPWESCGKPSGPPKTLGKEQSHCSFCARGLREDCNSSRGQLLNSPFSLCVGPGRPSPKNMMFFTWAHSHSNVTNNPSTKVKEDLGTPTYSFRLVCTA